MKLSGRGRLILYAHSYPNNYTKLKGEGKEKQTNHAPCEIAIGEPFQFVILLTQLWPLLGCV